MLLGFGQVGIISILSALVLYFATKDFIDDMSAHLSTVRVMAAAAVGIGLSKFVVMMPFRADLATVVDGRGPSLMPRASKSCCD